MGWVVDFEKLKNERKKDKFVCQLNTVDARIGQVELITALW